MRSGNNTHVQQHKLHMINEQWNKTQNDAPFVAFYDMRAVTFVLPDEMVDVSIAGGFISSPCGYTAIIMLPNVRVLSICLSIVDICKL